MVIPAFARVRPSARAPSANSSDAPKFDPQNTAMALIERIVTGLLSIRPGHCCRLAAPRDVVVSTFTTRVMRMCAATPQRKEGAKHRSQIGCKTTQSTLAGFDLPWLWPQLRQPVRRLFLEPKRTSDHAVRWCRGRLSDTGSGNPADAHARRKIVRPRIRRRRPDDRAACQPCFPWSH